MISRSASSARLGRGRLASRRRRSSPASGSSIRRVLLQSSISRFGDVGDRQHDVDLAGGDGALRHAVVFGVAGRLRDDDAARLLEPRDAGRAVGAGARQHDADRALAVRVGEGAKEQIDDDVAAARPVVLDQAERAVDHRQVVGRRNHVDVVALDAAPCPAPAPPACAWPLQDRRGIALVRAATDAARRRRPCPAAAGRPSSRTLIAARPPAEAPMPTTGKSRPVAATVGSSSGEEVGSTTGRIRDRLGRVRGSSVLRSGRDAAVGRSTHSRIVVRQAVCPPARRLPTLRAGPLRHNRDA